MIRFANTLDPYCVASSPRRLSLDFFYVNPPLLKIRKFNFHLFIDTVSTGYLFLC